MCWCLWERAWRRGKEEDDAERGMMERFAGAVHPGWGWNRKESGYQVKGDGCRWRSWKVQVQVQKRSSRYSASSTNSHWILVPGVQFRCENVPLSDSGPIVGFSEE